MGTCMDLQKIKIGSGELAALGYMQWKRQQSLLYRCVRAVRGMFAMGAPGLHYPHPCEGMETKEAKDMEPFDTNYTGQVPAVDLPESERPNMAQEAFVRTEFAEEFEKYADDFAKVTSMSLRIQAQTPDSIEFPVELQNGERLRCRFVRNVHSVGPSINHVRLEYGPMNAVPTVWENFSVWDTVTLKNPSRDIQEMVGILREKATKVVTAALENEEAWVADDKRIYFLPYSRKFFKPDNKEISMEAG